MAIDLGLRSSFTGTTPRSPAFHIGSPLSSTDLPDTQDLPTVAGGIDETPPINWFAGRENLQKKRNILVKRFILTGTPGSGKTAILRQLEIDGYDVIEEAATDVIALEHARKVPEPWTEPSFIDAIVNLQRERQLRGNALSGDIQFHDRSPICTHALATHLGFPISDALAREMERIERDRIFQKKVFFIRNFGTVVKTEARRISFDDALKFERIHEETYRAFGYQLVAIAPGTVRERTRAILRFVGDPSE